MIKKFIPIIIILSTWSLAQNQNSTTESTYNYTLKFTKANKSARMDEGRYGMGYTTDGEYIYAIYGKSGDPHYVTKSERYNIDNDEWSKFYNNTTNKKFVSAEYVGGKIYVFNGYNHDGSINENVEVIDISTGEASYLKQNPAPVCYSGTAVWNDKIYVFGGTGVKRLELMINYHNQFYLFDPTTDEWTSLGILPEHKHTTGEIIDGILYTFGGYNNHELSTIHAYSIADSTWQNIGDMPFDLSANAITKHGDFIWIVGGYNKTGFLAAFNTITHEFNIIKSNLIGRRHAGAVVINDILYVYGGSRGVGATIQMANISKLENLLSSSEKE